MKATVWTQTTLLFIQCAAYLESFLLSVGVKFQSFINQMKAAEQYFHVHKMMWKV